MSTRPTDDRAAAASRAEARRRARLAARGELPESDEPEEAPPEEPRRGFLSRIFPPAPPLPGRPDPLEGFDPDGPLRFVRERLFLLRRNLPAWLLTGLGAFVGFIGSLILGNSFLGLIGTFLLFGSLIAAGWIGWQRPTLYGTAAGLVAYFVTASWILLEVSRMAEQVPPGALIADLTLRGIYQAGLGFIGGWYGGYLRRRQTQLNAQTRRR
jgi:hypothetical protein